MVLLIDASGELGRERVGVGDGGVDDLGDDRIADVSLTKTDINL
jgi:hypothetical protein